MWKCKVISLLWGIWVERNNQIFEDESLSEEEFLKKLTVLWVSTHKELKDYSLLVLRLESHRFPKILSKGVQCSTLSSRGFIILLFVLFQELPMKFCFLSKIVIRIIL